MFAPETLKKLFDKHFLAFQKLVAVEDALNQRFYDMEEQIRALVLAVGSGEPLLLVGPPGCAKSRLIRAFCGVIGLIDEDRLATTGSDDRVADDGAYFEYLLTPFTEPGELFGFYDIAKLNRDGELVRQEDGMMQAAKVVFLDEIFNASSAILNSVLSVMNERIFHDRGERRPVELQCLFAATNHVPETPELRAFYDRFLLRCEVGNVRDAPRQFPDRLRRLIRDGWIETYSDHYKENLERRLKKKLGSLLEELAEFREDVRSLTTGGELVPHVDGQGFMDNLAQIIYQARDYEMSEMSNRRIIRMTFVMLVHRFYRAAHRMELGEFSFDRPELGLVARYFLDRRDPAALLGMERLAQAMGPEDA